MSKPFHPDGNVTTTLEAEALHVLEDLHKTRATYMEKFEAAFLANDTEEALAQGENILQVELEIARFGITVEV